MLCVKVMNLGESDTDTHCEVGHCISHQTTLHTRAASQAPATLHGHARGGALSRHI